MFFIAPVAVPLWRFFDLQNSTGRGEIRRPLFLPQKLKCIENAASGFERYRFEMWHMHRFKVRPRLCTSRKALPVNCQGAARDHHGNVSSISIIIDLYIG
jgi:hypothetical protein